MLSKKYYVALADLLRNCKDYSQFKMNLIEFLAEDNKDFDRTKFYTRMITLHPSGDFKMQVHRTLEAALQEKSESEHGDYLADLGKELAKER